ncbi:MAG TPA: hypothetical protein VL986_10425 [Terracidiphilus sp.]|nr:hypothetical protein [Terracidiphilus sp.]
MHSFRRLFLVLTLALPAFLAAQSTPSSLSSAGDTQTPDSSSSQAQQQPQQESGQTSVQARIKQRREQRRAAAIHETYGRLYEAFAGTSYLRFSPGASLQRTAFYGWDTGVTRFKTERFGYTFDARGFYGIAYTGLNQFELTRPKISMYNLMAGPTYRFYMTPKVSISGRALGGVSISDFSGDTNGYGSTALGIWPDGTTFAAGGGIIGQYNVAPDISLRLSGEDLATGFGSTVQNSFGFTAGFVYRFGKL